MSNITQEKKCICIFLIKQIIIIIKKKNNYLPMTCRTSMMDNMQQCLNIMVQIAILISKKAVFYFDGRYMLLHILKINKVHIKLLKLINFINNTKFYQKIN